MSDAPYTVETVQRDDAPPLCRLVGPGLPERAFDNQRRERLDDLARMMNLAYQQGRQAQEASK